ncbi:hypothetical protein Csa_000262 [Cucumis sativus]|uniref:Uncharacterized protein n=1 Tax=Cucumis sativus TaxID=3659 RepID=A0A0A0KKH1_CUCSA|nr:hypothetical protein Csa_000262 [Cucumis sativus]
MGEIDFGEKRHRLGRLHNQIDEWKWRGNVAEREPLWSAAISHDTFTITTLGTPLEPATIFFILPFPNN